MDIRQSINFYANYLLIFKLLTRTMPTRPRRRNNVDASGCMCMGYAVTSIDPSVRW